MHRIIMKAVADLGFTGYVPHEYSPTQGNDPIQEIAKAMETGWGNRVINNEYNAAGATLWCPTAWSRRTGHSLV